MTLDNVIRSIENMYNGDVDPVYAHIRRQLNEHRKTEDNRMDDLENRIAKLEKKMDKIHSTTLSRILSKSFDGKRDERVDYLEKAVADLVAKSGKYEPLAFGSRK